LDYQPDWAGNITRTMTLNSVGSMNYHGPPPLLTSIPPFVNELTSEGYGNDWFVRNEWYKLLQYAVAPGYAPGGAGSCTAPNCLTVSNLAAPNDNKGVTLVLAGRAIGTQDRSGSAARSQPFNYFEAPNCLLAGPNDCTLPPANNTFRQDTRSLTFNDRVVVVK
jgi:hypothetical protein